MASKSEPDCETKVITIPEQLDSGNVAPRSVIHLVSLKLQATLEGFGIETIKGVAGWNDQICVATNRFLVFFDGEDSYDESAHFKRDADLALPPEIGYVVTIAARSKSKSLYILSDWIWTLSRKHKLTKWIDATNVSSVSVSEEGEVLLAGNSTLTMYDKDGAMLKKFSMPREYHEMKICQAELTGADTIVVSVCGLGKRRVLLVNEEGIVKRIYDSSIGLVVWEIQSKDDDFMDTQCEIPNQFITLGKGGRFFVEETYSNGCPEKIVTLDKDFKLSQILLPDLRLQFKNYSRLSYSENQLIVSCMKVGHKDDANSKGRSEVLTPVVNVYEVDCESDSETEDDNESDDQSETENKIKSSEIPDDFLAGSYSTKQSD